MRSKRTKNPVRSVFQTALMRPCLIVLTVLPSTTALSACDSVFRDCPPGLATAWAVSDRKLSGADPEANSAIRVDGQDAASPTDAATVTMDEERLRRLLEELRCLVCQNQSLYDSQADLAVDLRVYVTGRMREGLSDAAIREDLVSKYGDFVLYRPPLKASTWLLWAFPFLILAGGFLLLGWFLYRRRRAVGAPDAGCGDGLR